MLVRRGFTVICADLRGYGRSRGPAPSADHSAHCKRATAGDLVAVMQALGHDRFALAGHDRGSQVALRLTLDHPELVSRLALLDCIPISEQLARADAEFATRWWHWFFFAQPDIPERVINADPDSWYRGDPETMGRENFREWRRAINDPAVVRAMLEDYRAGLTIDRQHEEQDRAAGRQLECPLLVLWSLLDDLEDRTATYSASGAPGQPMSVGTGSLPVTTWPRRHRKNWRRRSGTSSRRPDPGSRRRSSRLGEVRRSKVTRSGLRRCARFAPLCPSRFTPARLRVSCAPFGPCSRALRCDEAHDHANRFR